MNPSRFIDFTGKWIVLTGASSGIGRAVAHELASRGAKLVLVGRRHEALASLAAELSPAGTRTLSLDLSDVSGIEPALRALREEIGLFYGLCHSAGTVATMPLRGTTPDLVSRTLSVNLQAGLELARAVSGRRDMEDGGAIVFVSSIYAHVGAPGQVSYCASKGAVVSAMKAMALELAPRRIRVNAVSPGFVKTQMTDEATSRLTEAQVDAIVAKHPLGPGLPADVSRAVAFLLAPQSRWITGTDLIVDGGRTAQ